MSHPNPHYDGPEPETEADKAAWFELVRLAPFKKAWPEEDGWTWTSPHDRLIEGSCEYETDDGYTETLTVILKTTDRVIWTAGRKGHNAAFVGRSSMDAAQNFMAAWSFP